jgi:hypothetical protein
LPSQQGFGTDLMAQNVIVPIIDLTETAAGATTPEFLQRALSFDSQTVFNIASTTTVIANTAGFWQIQGVSSQRGSSSTNQSNRFTLSDGLSNKIIWEYEDLAGNSEATFQNYFEFVVFLNSGESISGTSNGNAQLSGTTRQIATVDGTLVNPAGFSPQ